GILVHVVEPDPMDGTDPLANYRTIRSELVQYDPTLAERPEILVVSKCELPGAEEVRRALAEETGGDVLAISAATGDGLDRLVAAIAAALDRREAPA
ncbi:MAG: GTPase ObgE, partial [Planctomycetota bacterium]